jgi:hypothetical protein
LLEVNSSLFELGYLNIMDEEGGGKGCARIGLSLRCELDFFMLKLTPDASEEFSIRSISCSSMGILLILNSVGKALSEE